MSEKRYSELIKIESFTARVKYLMIGGLVCDKTFGYYRYLNQLLYNSLEWKLVRRKVMIRDDGYDLAHKDYLISGPIYIHHIEPITVEDVLKRNHKVFDLENLISTSFSTHNLIHYGNEEQIPKDYVERYKNDTCPWKVV